MATVYEFTEKTVNITGSRVPGGKALLNQQFPSVSVVIPTKNRPDDLEKACRSLLVQKAYPRQVIIVDQSRDDESQRRVAPLFTRQSPEASRLRLDYIRAPYLGGVTAARNCALKVVQADVVLFLDDDVVLEPDFVAEIADVYKRFPNATGVSGIITNYRRPPLAYRVWARAFVCGPFHDDRQPVYWRAERIRSGGPVPVSRLGGGLMSFRVSQIQGMFFDENLSGSGRDGEDIDFCAHLGPKALLLITPKARLVHNASPVGRPEQSWLRAHARSFWYLYRRNWNRGVKNRLWLLWLNFGYSLVAVLASLHRLSVDPWRGLLAGIRESRQLAGHV